MSDLYAQGATVSGQAHVTPAKPAAIAGQPAVITAVIQVTRAATGLTEEYVLTGVPSAPESKKEPE